jgi:hypothetical protein
MRLRLAFYRRNAPRIAASFQKPRGVNEGPWRRIVYYTLETLGIVLAVDLLSDFLTEDEREFPEIMIDDEVIIDNQDEVLAAFAVALTQVTGDDKWSTTEDPERWMSYLNDLMSTEGGIQTVFAALNRVEGMQEPLEYFASLYMAEVGDIENSDTLNKQVAEEAKMLNLDSNALVGAVDRAIQYRSELGALDAIGISTLPTMNQREERMVSDYRYLVEIVGYNRWVALRDLLALRDKDPDLLEQLDREIDLQRNLSSAMLDLQSSNLK